MIATARPKPTRQIRRRELDQFRQSIGVLGETRAVGGQDGDSELAAGYAEDVAELRAIVRPIEDGALHEAAETIDCLDTLIQYQIPSVSTRRRYRAVDALDKLIHTPLRRPNGIP